MTKFANIYHKILSVKESKMAIHQGIELVNDCQYPKDRYLCGNEVTKPLEICKKAKEEEIEQCKNPQTLSPEEKGLDCIMKECPKCNAPKPQILQQGSYIFIK